MHKKTENSKDLSFFTAKKEIFSLQKHKIIIKTCRGQSETCRG